MKIGGQSLRATNSRSQLGKLIKPKRKQQKSLPQRTGRNSSDSSSDQSAMSSVAENDVNTWLRDPVDLVSSDLREGDDKKVLPASNENGSGRIPDGNSGGVSAPPIKENGQLRSMIVRGGSSGSAAALAIKQKFGWKRSKFSTQGKEVGALRFDRGKTMGTRPPVQHSESLDSSVDEDRSVLSREGGGGAGVGSVAGGGDGGRDANSLSTTNEPQQHRDEAANNRGEKNTNNSGFFGSDEKNDTTSSEDPGGDGLDSTDPPEKGEPNQRRGAGETPADKSSSLRVGENGRGGGMTERLRRLGPRKKAKAKSAKAEWWPKRVDGPRSNNDDNDSAGGDDDDDDDDDSDDGSPAFRGSPLSRPVSTSSESYADDSSGTFVENPKTRAGSFSSSPPRDGSTIGGWGRVDHGRAPLLGSIATSRPSSFGKKQDRLDGGKGKGLDDNTPTASARRANSAAAFSLDGFRRRLKTAWGNLDGDIRKNRGVEHVAGKGKPSAGFAENLLYRWLGGIVAGRAWPGVGLALRPTFNGVDGENGASGRIQPDWFAREEDVIRIDVLGTNALPDDSRITQPMIVVHIVDSSTGRYFRKTPRSRQAIRRKGLRSPVRNDEIAAQNYDIYDNEETLAVARSTRLDGTLCPKNFPEDVGEGDSEGHKRQGDRVSFSPERRRRRHSREREEKEMKLVSGGSTTTFEERTTWDFAMEKLETGEPCETVPPVATQPWLMTLKSSTPTWDETLVFAEGYRRLFSPDTLVLFELVDFVAGSSLKEARKGGGLVKIAWGFLRPLGARGECNVGVRQSAGRPQPPNAVYDPGLAQLAGGYEHGDDEDCVARRSTLQLFEHRQLSMLARWQARQRGFPRVALPVCPEVPDVFLQFLCNQRKRYPATLDVSVRPTPRQAPVLVFRRPMVPHEQEGHQLSYDSLAAMYEKSREVRTNGEPGGFSTGIGNTGAGRGDAARAARARRARDKNERCVLPDRLLHRVYAGQNGAITLSFSGSGSLLAAACCDDPLPGRFPIRLIDSESGRCRHELQGHASMVYSLVWSPGDGLLVSASSDGTAKVWYVSGSDGEGGGGGGGVEDTPGGGMDEPRLVCTLQHAPPCFVYAAVFQPAALENGRGGAEAGGGSPGAEGSECALVITAAYDRSLRLWDIAASALVGGRGKLLGALGGKVVHESYVNAIVYDAKYSRVYSGDGVGTIVVWRRGSGGRVLEDYSVLRKVQHVDLIGKAITSLALSPRFRRGQLLVQAHGNTLRLLDLGTYQLVNPGFAGGAAAGSLVRASFSPDGRFVVSGSEKGQIRVWEAQEGKRVRTPLQTLGMACSLRDVAWHPHQHVLALAGYGQDAPVLLYWGEARADRQAKAELQTLQPPAVVDEAAREVTSAEEHRRRLENRQRLRELRIKRLRAKALGFVDGAPHDGNGTETGVAAALAALTSAARQTTTKLDEGPAVDRSGDATAAPCGADGRQQTGRR